MSVESVSAIVELERNIARRKETDRIMSFPMWILLGLVTLGIAILVAEYRLIKRRNEHFKRQKRVEESILNALRPKAAQVDITLELANMSSVRKDGNDEEEEKSAIGWVIVGLIPLIGTVTNFFVYYFLTRDVYTHNVRQTNFVNEFDKALNKLGVDTTLLSNALKVQYQVPNRWFVKYLLLSIVTFGIFFIYWTYLIYKDWNNHFKTQWPIEDEILSLVKRTTLTK